MVWLSSDDEDGGCLVVCVCAGLGRRRGPDRQDLPFSIDASTIGN